MCHILVNLAIGQREKNIWGYKKLQGRQKGYKGVQKNIVDLFNFIFRHSSFCGGWGAKNQERAPNCDVTPLFILVLFLIFIFLYNSNCCLLQCCKFFSIFRKDFKSIIRSGLI